jgi:VirB8 protein
MGNRMVESRREFAALTKYYEHDGMLRAYANRAMFLAVIFALIAVASLGLAIYVRIEPPMVIHVDADGNATVVGGPRRDRARDLARVLSGGNQDRGNGESVARTELEARAVVRQFLEHYLAYTPDSAARNLAESLNMMTENLRKYAMNRLRDEDTVGKIKDGQVISDFRIRSIEKVPTTPWSFIVFAAKEIHRLKNGSEVTDTMVGKYNVRLLVEPRSELNPSGFVVAEYSEEQMTGDRQTSLLQQSELEKK